MVSPNGHIGKEIHEILDMDLIQQQIKNHVFNIRPLIDFIISKLQQLCAPVRDGNVRHLKQLTDLSEIFEGIMDLLEHMKLDLANYRQQALRPLLKSYAVEYESKKFDDALASQLVSLTQTTSWLQNSVKNLKDVAASRNPEGIDSSESRIRYEEVYHDALLSLVFSQSILQRGSLPETFLLDEERMIGFQNEAQAITIVAALIMLSKNFSDDFRKNQPAIQKLKSTLFILLKDSQTTLDHLSIQIISSINACLAKKPSNSSTLPSLSIRNKEISHSSSSSTSGAAASSSNLSNTSPINTTSTTSVRKKGLTQDQEALIRTMVEKTLSYRDTVYLLLNRRVNGMIRQQLVTGIFKRESLSSNGLDIVGTELEDLSRRITLLARHNKEVYAKHYDAILRQYLSV